MLRSNRVARSYGQDGRIAAQGNKLVEIAAIGPEGFLLAALFPLGGISDAGDGAVVLAVTLALLGVSAPAQSVGRQRFSVQTLDSWGGAPPVSQGAVINPMPLARPMPLPSPPGRLGSEARVLAATGMGLGQLAVAAGVLPLFHDRLLG